MRLPLCIFIVSLCGMLQGAHAQSMFVSSDPVMVLASQKLSNGTWEASAFLRSYGRPETFSDVLTGCEVSVTEALTDAGMSVVVPAADPAAQAKAHSVKPLLDRYGRSFVGLPNDSAVKIAKAFDPKTSAVIVCNAVARRTGRGRSFQQTMSAEVQCRAILVRNQKQVAQDRELVNWMHMDQEQGERQAVRRACSQIGVRMAAALVQ